MTYEEYDNIKIGDEIDVGQGDNGDNCFGNCNIYERCIITKKNTGTINFKLKSDPTKTCNHDYNQKREDGVEIFKIIKNSKQNTMNISTIAKKIFDKDTKTLIKAEYLKDDLSLTEKGEEALYGLLFSEKKDELVKLAQEELDEKKEECCK